MPTLSVFSATFDLSVNMDRPKLTILIVRLVTAVTLWEQCNAKRSMIIDINDNSRHPSTRRFLELENFDPLLDTRFYC